MEGCWISEEGRRKCKLPGQRSPYTVVLGTCGSPQSLPQIDEKASLYSRTTAAPTHNRCRHHRRGVSGHAQVRTVQRLSASNVYLTDRICVSKTVLYLPSTTSRLMPKHIRNQHRPCNHTHIIQHIPPTKHHSYVLESLCKNQTSNGQSKHNTNNAEPPSEPRVRIRTTRHSYVHTKETGNQIHRH